MLILTFFYQCNGMATNVLPSKKSGELRPEGWRIETTIRLSLRLQEKISSLDPAPKDKTCTFSPWSRLAMKDDQI